MTTLYDDLVIVIDAANRDLEDGSMTQAQYNAKKKSTIKKMDLFLKRKRISQEQYDELIAKFK